MGYFYSGNVILSNLIDDYKNASKDLIYMVNSQDDLMDALDKIIEEIDDWNSESKKKIRRNFAEENSYTQKLIDIGKILYS